MALPATATLQLRADLAELPRLAACIESFAEQHELHPKDTFALNLAAEELFANTVKHSHPPATAVELRLEHDCGRVTVTYCDDGAPYDPTQQPGPDLTLPVELRPIGGLGIHFIRQSMSRFEYRRDGLFNCVTFTRTLV